MLRQVNGGLARILDIGSKRSEWPVLDSKDLLAKSLEPRIVYPANCSAPVDGAGCPKQLVGH